MKTNVAEKKTQTGEELYSPVLHLPSCLLLCLLCLWSMQDSSCSAATGVSRQRRQRTACAFPRDASRSDKTIALDVLGMKRGLNISTKCCANVTPQPRGNLDITYKVTPLLFPPAKEGPQPQRRFSPNRNTLFIHIMMGNRSKTNIDS